MRETKTEKLVVNLKRKRNVIRLGIFVFVISLIGSALRTDFTWFVFMLAILIFASSKLSKVSNEIKSLEKTKQ